MLGVSLLFVGIVLINNGIVRACRIDAKAGAVMNVFVGILSIFINFTAIAKGATEADFFAAGTGLLFAFTYLFVAAMAIFNLKDERPFGWFSLFVAVNAVAVGCLNVGTDWRMAVIWWLWAILWTTGFVETVLGKPLGRLVPFLQITEGIVTAWIPGFLMLIGCW